MTFTIMIYDDIQWNTFIYNILELVDYTKSMIDISDVKFLVSANYL